MNPSAAAIAVHRFGLGEPDLARAGAEPVDWLLAQLGPADAQRGDGLVSGAQGLRQYAEFLARLRQPERAAAAAAATEGGMATPPGMAGPGGTAPGAALEAAAAAPLRAVVQADVRARLVTAATTSRPFAERLALFWANPFTVSLAKNGARGVVGAFEREAIRPHIGGRFETLLQAAVTHAGMLR